MTNNRHDATQKGRLSAKGVLGRALLVLLSAACTLMGIEIFLRFQEPRLHLLRDRSDINLGRYRVHHVWHHWMRPNSFTGIRGREEYPEPILYRTNRHGCRDDRQFDGPAPQGTYRIIVMGDSFTEGYYPEDSFGRVLQSRLNALDNPLDYEVINCGTTSYSPLLHLLRYKHQLRELEPDEVIVNIDLTDIFDDNWRYRQEAAFAVDGEPLSAGPAPFSAKMIADELRFRYYTARLLFGRPSNQVTLPMAENVFAYHRDLSPESTRWQQDVGFTLDLMRRLVREIERSGARVTFSMYPYREQLESVDGGPIWNRAFEAKVAVLARELDVPFYSAFDDVERLFREGHKLYWADDFHLNPSGQRAWSEAFARYYVNRVAGNQ